MRRYLPTVFFVAAAAAVVLGTQLPLWRVLLYFPQYPEGPLQVVAYASAVRGDLGELDTLNEYIGVTFPHHIPELVLLPRLLYAIAALALVAAVVRGRAGLWLKGGTIATMAACGSWMLWRINGYLTDFGAHPDPSAPLHSLVKSFKPPLWGTVKIVQVKAVAGFLPGAYLLAAAGVLLLLGFWLMLRPGKTHLRSV